MSKFVVVPTAPVSLRKGESVIESPKFLEQIRANAHRAAKKKLTGINHLRGILEAIQQSYETDLNVPKIPLSLYEGIAFDDENDLSRLIVRLLKSERPAVFEKVLEYNIKNRPHGSKVIYYVGDLHDTTPFFRNGMDMIELQDVDVELGIKAKKIVGKPAVTKEQSEESAS